MTYAVSRMKDLLLTLLHLRNRVVHVYFEVDPDILWDTVHNDLPKLVDPLKRLLG
jgi:uncharacterized protein with HEPN domain